MNTDDDFKAMTGEGVEEADIVELAEVEDDEPVDLDEKIVDPLLSIDEEEEVKEESEDDVEADMAALMWQDYEER